MAYTNFERTVKRRINRLNSLNEANKKKFTKNTQVLRHEESESLTLMTLIDSTNDQNIVIIERVNIASYIFP